MTIPAFAMAIAAFIFTLLAGYLWGVRRGKSVREALLKHIKTADLGGQLVTASGDPAPEWQTEIRKLLEPLASSERVKQSLAQIDVGSGKRTELPRLLDAVKSQGGFSACLLVDDAGFPLAASSGTLDTEVLAGLTALVPSLIDRTRATGEPAPISLSLHDEDDRFILHRSMQVKQERYFLTALSQGHPIPHNTLDSVLGVIEEVLTSEAWTQ